MLGEVGILISLLCQPTVATFALTFIISPRYKFAVCNLPFTEGVITDGWRLKVKINQSFTEVKL